MPALGHVAAERSYVAAAADVAYSEGPLPDGPTGRRASAGDGRCARPLSPPAMVRLAMLWRQQRQQLQKDRSYVCQHNDIRHFFRNPESNLPPSVSSDLVVPDRPSWHTVPFHTRPHRYGRSKLGFKYLQVSYFSVVYLNELLNVCYLNA